MSEHLEREREALRRAAPDPAPEEGSIGRVLVREGAFLAVLTVATTVLCLVGLACAFFAIQ